MTVEEREKLDEATRLFRAFIWTVERADVNGILDKPLTNEMVLCNFEFSSGLIHSIFITVGDWKRMRDSINELLKEY